MEIEINIKRHSVLDKVRENVAVTQGHVDLDKHWSNNLKALAIRYNNTSDVVAVQQRLHVADLLQQSSLGEQEVLLCADKHKTESPWALNQMQVDVLVFYKQTFIYKIYIMKAFNK